MMLDRSLVARMDANLMDYWGAYALADGGRHERLSEALFMQTTVPHSLFNSVILSGHEPAAVETALGLAADYTEASGVPVLWRVGPMAENAALRVRLERAGLERSDPEPAMIANLSDLSPPPNIESLVITMASGPEDRRAWGRLALAAFELEDSLSTAMGACEAKIPPNLFEGQPRFTAFLDGEPVAVTSLVMTGDLAGVYAVATLPNARNRGVGTAMTLHAMAEAQRRGATMAILQASPMGRPIYERIGFRTVFDYQTYLQS